MTFRPPRAAVAGSTAAFHCSPMSAGEVGHGAAYRRWLPSADRTRQDDRDGDEARRNRGTTADGLWHLTVHGRLDDRRLQVGEAEGELPGSVR
jgi:hypothetical protein